LNVDRPPSLLEDRSGAVVFVLDFHELHSRTPPLHVPDSFNVLMEGGRKEALSFIKNDDPCVVQIDGTRLQKLT
jgi:hypothetical protein